MARGRPRKQTSQNGNNANPTKDVRKSTGRGKSKRGPKPKAKNGERASNTGDKKPWEYSDDDYEIDSNISELTASDGDELKDFDVEDEEYDPLADGDRESETTEAHPDEADCFTWMDGLDEEPPPLDLPQCSMDLLVEGDLLFDTLEIYETCRTYYRLIQISPFLFEDFCCALRSPDQTKLLAEIHIALLRLLFRDDEDEQTLYSVQDTNNSFNILLQLLEPMTYAEILRQYVESDSRFPRDVLNIMQSNNYPFVDGRSRVVVLRWLCERFLETNIFKAMIKNDGKFIYDSHCRDCGKPGDVLLCDGCEACYHLSCASLSEVPQGNWFCRVCVEHKIHGVTDCLLPNQKPDKQSIRLKPLGSDRHGRAYWLLARRIFVQDHVNNLVYYYSTLPQVYELVSRLDSAYYEKRLCKTFCDIMPTISDHMRITLELTDTRRLAILDKIGGTRELAEAYLRVDNRYRMSQVIAEIARQNGNLSPNEEHQHVGEEVRRLLLSDEDQSAALIWTDGQTEKELIAFRRQLDENPTLEDELLVSLQRGFRLGFSDGWYRNYVNLFSVNEYAQSPYLRAKERDKKKYMCTRFALTDEGEFEWIRLKSRDIYSNNAFVAKFVQLSLKKFVERIPDELMHRLWKTAEKEKFLEALQNANSVESLRYLLLQFEKAMRKPVFTNVWWNSLGHIKLLRTTTEDREKRQKVEIRKKKEERALIVADLNEDADIAWVRYTRLGGPPKHNIWRMKDEQYRVNGRDNLGGWLWVSSTRVRRYVDVPLKPPRNITADTPTAEVTSNEAMKSYRLDQMVRKLQQSHTKLEENVFDEKPNGIANPAKEEMNGYGYSEDRQINENIKRNYEHPALNNVLGEGKAFPFPKPFTYEVHSTHKRNLLVLPQPALRKLARQGGLQQRTFIPGFHRQAKSNTLVWNYPCPRPLFDNCWRYLTLNARSLHAIALQMRIMYSCIRWSDMEPDEDDRDDPRVVTHFPDYDEVRTVIGHKENPPDGYYEQYKLRLEQYSLEDLEADTEDGDDSTNYRSGHRSSTRKKKRTAFSKPVDYQRKKRKVLEQWIDGVSLKLYEIRNYWKNYHRKLLPRPAPSSVPRPFSQAYPQHSRASLSFANNGNQQRIVLSPAILHRNKPSGTPPANIRYVPATQSKVVFRLSGSDPSQMNGHVASPTSHPYYVTEQSENPSPASSGGILVRRSNPSVHFVTRPP